MSIPETQQNATIKMLILVLSFWFSCKFLYHTEAKTGLHVLQPLHNPLADSDAAFAFHADRSHEFHSMLEVEGVSSGEPESEGDVRSHKDMLVFGTVFASHFEAKSVSVEGSVEVKGEVIAPHGEFGTLQADSISVSKISSPTGVIEIEGDVILVNPSKAQEETSFIEIDSWEGGPGWKEVDVGYMERWTGGSIERCQNASGVHLQVSCGESAKKSFAILESHKIVKIAFNARFIDHWQGEVAFMVANGQVIWMDTLRGGEKGSGMSLCGNSRYDEIRFGVYQEIVVEHEGNAISLEFGMKSGANECSSAFGIENVQISVR